MTTDYTPIDCGLYSQFELAVMRGDRLRICWRKRSGETHIETLRPRDLQTRNHEEFLIAEDRFGRRRALRLDYIFKSETV
jgi:Rho-binding antiterminator